MTAGPQVLVEWANGEYLFALRMAQIEAIESECMNADTGKPGVGFGTVFTRVMGSSWYYSDITNIIRHGLIGGGLGAVEAMRLVKNYVETVPISTLTPGVGPNSPLALAQTILASAMVGVEEDQKSSGKTEALETE